MLSISAKTAAERKREQRERQKLNRLKDVTFTLDMASIEIVTSHSTKQGITQSDFVINAINNVVTSHNITESNSELKAEYEQQLKKLVTSHEAENEALKARIAELEHDLKNQLRINELNNDEFDIAIDKLKNDFNYVIDKMTNEISFLSQSLIEIFEFFNKNTTSKLKAKLRLEALTLLRAENAERDFSKAAIQKLLKF